MSTNYKILVSDSNFGTYNDIEAVFDWIEYQQHLRADLSNVQIVESANDGVVVIYTVSKFINRFSWLKV